MARVKQTSRKSKQGAQKTIASNGSGHHKKKSGVSMGGIKEDNEKKRRKWKPGTVAARRVKEYQKSSESLLKKIPFQRLVRAIATSIRADLRFREMSIEALRQSSERVLVDLLSRAHRGTRHASRSMLMRKDVEHAMDMATDPTGAHKATRQGKTYVKI